MRGGGTDIYLLHPRKLSVVGSSVLYMYIAGISPY